MFRSRLKILWTSFRCFWWLRWISKKFYIFFYNIFILFNILKNNNNKVGDALRVIGLSISYDAIVKKNKNNNDNNNN